MPNSKVGSKPTLNVRRLAGRLSWPSTTAEGGDGFPCASHHQGVDLVWLGRHPAREPGGDGAEGGDEGAEEDLGRQGVAGREAEEGREDRPAPGRRVGGAHRLQDAGDGPERCEGRDCPPRRRGRGRVRGAARRSARGRGRALPGWPWAAASGARLDAGLDENLDGREFLLGTRPGIPPARGS